MSTYDELAEVEMTFGKHKGRPLCEIPENYLMWTLENCHRMPEQLRLDIYNYLQEMKLGNEALSSPQAAKPAANGNTVPPAGKASNGYSFARTNPGTFSISMPHGNHLEIRVREKMRPADKELFREVCQMAEKFLFDDEPPAAREPKGRRQPIPQAAPASPLDADWLPTVDESEAPWDGDDDEIFINEEIARQ